MTIEEGFMWFGLVMLAAAFVVNYKAQQILDESKHYADLWAKRIDEAVALAEEAKVIHENALRIRDSR